MDGSELLVPPMSGMAHLLEVDEIDRLRSLADVSEAMIGTLDGGESATALAQLLVPQRCDWALVALVGEDGAPQEEARVHRDPAMMPDLNTYLDGRIRGTGDGSPLVEALLTGRPVQLDPIDQAIIEPSLPTPDSSSTRLPSRATTVMSPRRAVGTATKRSRRHGVSTPPMGW